MMGFQWPVDKCNKCVWQWTLCDVLVGVGQSELTMEKRKWLWKRKSSDKSPGETESSGSISSHSERYSDDQVCNYNQVCVKFDY